MSLLTILNELSKKCGGPEMFVEEQPQKKKILCELACDSVIEDTRLQLSRPYIKRVKAFFYIYGKCQPQTCITEEGDVCGLYYHSLRCHSTTTYIYSIVGLRSNSST